MENFKTFYESDDIMGEPTWSEEDARDTAKKFNVLFQKRWPDTIFYTFTDPENMSTFLAKDYDNFIERYYANKEKTFPTD